MVEGEKEVIELAEKVKARIRNKSGLIGRRLADIEIGELVDVIATVIIAVLESEKERG